VLLREGAQRFVVLAQQDVRVGPRPKTFVGMLRAGLLDKTGVARLLLHAGQGVELSAEFRIEEGIERIRQLHEVAVRVVDDAAFHVLGGVGHGVSLLFSPDDAPASPVRKRIRAGYRPDMKIQEIQQVAARGRNAKTALFAGLGLAALAWIAVTTAATMKEPGVGGFFAGLFGGFFIALLIAGASAWLALSIVVPFRKLAELGDGAALEASLKDVLDELEKRRLETVARINQRAAWR